MVVADINQDRSVWPFPDPILPDPVEEALKAVKFPHFTNTDNPVDFPGSTNKGRLPPRGMD